MRDAATRRVLAERAAPLGKVSNNVAEYTGLVVGLETVLRLGRADGPVLVRMDSKLVIEQMSGRWKIKHEDMRRLASQAQDLVRQVRAAGGTVRFEWVPRAENAAADTLSNVGMDGRTVDRVLDQPDDVSGLGDVPAPGQVPVDPAAAAGPVHSGAAGPDLSGGTRVLLVRHGVTVCTEEGRLCGKGGANPPLSPLGERQAAATADALRTELAGAVGPLTVLTSDLRRAVQTGEVIADALRASGATLVQERDPDLDEQAFGRCDGQQLSELVAASPTRAWRWREDTTFAFPDGESHDELLARVVPALRRAVGRGGTVVLVSHRKTILCVLQWALGLEYAKAWRLAVAPCSITSLQVWADGGVSVAATNATGHLAGLESAPPRD